MKLGAAVLGYLNLPAGLSLLYHNLSWTALGVTLSVSLVVNRYQNSKKSAGKSFVRSREEIQWLAIGFVLYCGLYLALKVFDQNPVESETVNALIDILIIFLWSSTFGIFAYSCALQVAVFMYQPERHTIDVEEGGGEQVSAPRSGTADTAQGVLRGAIKAVPAVKYALGVAGIVAAISIIKAFGLDLRIAGWGTVIMLFLMAALFLFNKLTQSSVSRFAAPATVFTWFTLFLFMATSLAMFGSVFFKYPVDLQYWIAEKRAEKSPAATSASTATTPIPGDTRQRKSAKESGTILRHFSPKTDVGAVHQPLLGQPQDDRPKNRRIDPKVSRLHDPERDAQYRAELTKYAGDEAMLASLGEEAFAHKDYGWTIKFLEQARIVQSTKVWQKDYPYLAAAFLLANKDRGSFEIVLQDMLAEMRLNSSYLHHSSTIGMTLQNLTNVRQYVDAWAQDYIDRQIVPEAIRIKQNV